MTSTFFGLEISKRGLTTQMAGLDVTGHNISNANTQGYTRQIAYMEATDPIYVPGMGKPMETGQLGTGSGVQSIQRAREFFLDNQFYEQNQALGQWQTKADTYNKLQGILSVPQSSILSTDLQKFFSGWRTLVQNPTDPTSRLVVMNAATSVAGDFNNLQSQLSVLHSDILSKAQDTVTQVNSYLQQIATLNNQISNAELDGKTNANDLRDKRDLLVDKLSQLINLQPTEKKGSTPEYTLSIGGKVVLQDNKYDTFSIADDGSGNLITNDIQGFTIDPNGNPVAGGPQFSAFSLQGGTLMGLNDSYKTVANYQSQIDSMAAGFANAVNAQHTQGYDLNGNPGKPLFTYNAQSPSGTIALNSAISSINDLAAGLTTAQGDGDNAEAMGELQNKAITFTNGIIATGTIGDYFKSVAGELGDDGMKAQQEVNNQTALTQAIDQNRQSVSGVSLDEEMTQMIRFQSAYQASARMITTVDTTLQTILNMGLVGR